MGEIIDSGIKRRYPRTKRDIWAQPEPPQEMVWEVCPYIRGQRWERCEHCPPWEDSEHGKVQRMCYCLAAEASPHRFRLSIGGEMNRDEFRIGLEFFTETGRWRCTDIGTRVIVAISLNPRRSVRLHGPDPGPGETLVIANDPSWFNGPPYAVAEYVFDEDDMPGCSHEPLSDGDR